MPSLTSHEEDPLQGWNDGQFIHTPIVVFCHWYRARNADTARTAGAAAAFNDARRKYESLYEPDMGFADGICDFFHLEDLPHCDILQNSACESNVNW